MQQKSTLRLYDNRASLVSLDPSIAMPGSRVEIFQVITLAGQPGGQANEPSEKQDSRTLFMRIASPAHVIRPLL